MARLSEHDHRACGLLWATAGLPVISCVLLVCVPTVVAEPVQSPGGRLKVHLSWGHRTPGAVSFHVELHGQDLSVTGLKFSIDRGAGVRNDLGNLDRFQFAFDFGQLNADLARTWRGQKLANGLPVITTTLEREGVRYEVEQFSYIACAFSHGPLEPVEHRWTWGQYFGPPSTDGAWFELYRNIRIQAVQVNGQGWSQFEPEKNGCGSPIRTNGIMRSWPPIEGKGI